jgi:hypothetical protein
MKKNRMTLMPLFRDKNCVPLQPLREIDVCYSISPLVAIQIHLPYDTVDTLLVLDTELPVGNLAYIRGIPLLDRDRPYRVILHKEKAPPTRFYFKERGYTFGHQNIIDVRDIEDDPLIPDISIRFVHENYQLLINRSPFTVKIAVEDEDDGEGGLAYAGRTITMEALECSFNIVGNLLVDHDVLPTTLS